MEYTLTNDSDSKTEVGLIGWLQNMANYQTATSPNGTHINTIQKKGNT
jgi:hypothetical protein